MIDPTDSRDEERETAALLAQLKATPSAEARERAFVKLQQEFHAARISAPRAAPRRSMHRWAMAAGVATLLIASAAWFSVPVATVARVEVLDGGVVASGPRWFNRTMPLASGTEVMSGQSLSVANGAGVLLRISPDLSVRLAAGTQARVVAADEIELTEGRAFVDATPGACAPLRVVTPHGVVTHLGTQYLVSAAPGRVDVSVREGRAQLQSGDATVVADAGHWLVNRAGDTRPTTGEIAPDDTRFDWIGALPSDFHLEGATLGQFLAWFQRETGLTVVYSGGTTNRDLAGIRLRGSIDQLEPMQALGFVLATADLTWHRDGAKIIVEKRISTGG